MNLICLYFVTQIHLGASSSPLIGTVFAKTDREIQDLYPSCKIQTAEPLLFRCPMRLYHASVDVLFIFDEIHRVKGIIAEFEPRASIDATKPILTPLLNALADQFGSAQAKRTGTTGIWSWSNSHAVVEVKVEKNSATKVWQITAALAEAKPPNLDEEPGKQKSKAPNRGKP